MKDPYQIILKPRITEKSTILRDSNKFTFLVDIKATKTEIRRAAEELFDLKGKILDVNTIRIRGKTKGQLYRYRRGRQPNRKKAILTVEAGTSIQLFDSI